MQRAPERIFILENGKYIEISYDDYLRLKEENPTRRFLLLGGMLMEVPEEDYVKMNREKSRQQYLRKLSKKFGEFSYDSLATDEFDGALILVDDKADIHETVEQKILVDKLHNALNELSDEDAKLIRALYFEDVSEREYAVQMGVSQVAVHKRKQKVLQKLKSMI